MLTQRIISYIMALILSIPGFAGAIFSKENPQVDDNIKNVIFVIGDGMGINHINKAKQELGLDFVMESRDDVISGWSITTSVSGTTDSAAGGTALSCGIKTINKYVGVYSFDPLRVFATPKSITEICRDNGMKTGVITSDKTVGATPSDFTVHTYNRDNKEDILKQQALSGFDLIWGADTSAYTGNQVIKDLFTENNVKVLKNKADVDALQKGEKSYGQFKHDVWNPNPEDPTNPNLSYLTKKALSVLDNENGFFLMVEAGAIDSFSHDADGDNMVKAVEELNNTMKLVLDYAEKDGHTMVVLTADHETGGIKKIAGKYYYTMYNLHTGVNVPLYVYGTDKLISEGETTTNIYIPRKINAILGFDSKEFDLPCCEDSVIFKKCA